MSKVLLSQPYAGETGKIGCDFYRQGIGFGRIEADAATGEESRYAVVSFADRDDLVSQGPLYDIDLAAGRRGRPTANLEDSETAQRLATVGLNGAMSIRREEIAAGYGTRLSKPRIQRALTRRLIAEGLLHSPISHAA